MALIIKDRVKETTTTTGTGTITLAGASTGFRSFADIGNANTTYYCISGESQFEVGVGTYTASGTTLSRDTVLSNSLGTTALINFSAGTKDVFCTYPSGKAILGDTSAISSTGTGSVVLSASPTLTGTVQLPNSSFVSGTSTIGYAANVSVGQPDYLTNNTIQIGGNEPSSLGGTKSTINIGANYISIGEDSAEATTTNINGDVVFPAATSAESVIFNKQVSIESSSSLSVASNFNLTGSTTSSQNIATNQTSGSLTIGGTSATGAITLGRSTGAQTVNIATGTTSASTTKAINIGTAGNATSTTNIAIGATAGTSTTSLNGNIILSKTATPASATATGTAGTIVWDANYIYICTATNTWKRVAISTW